MDYIVETIELAQVHADKNQPRKKLENLDSLMSSIVTVGLNEPIKVQPTRAKDGIQQYQVMSGGRRFAAISKLGWQSAQFLVGEKLQGGEKLLSQTVSNSLRDDLSVIDELETFVRLKEDKGLTMETIVKGLGKSEATLEAGLPILNLPENIKEDVDLGKFGKGAAIHLASEIDPEHWEGAYKNAEKAKTEKSAIARMNAYVKETTEGTDDHTDLQKEHPKPWKNSNKAYKGFVKAGKKIVADADVSFIVDGNRSRLADFKDDLKTLRKAVDSLQNAVVVFEAQDSTKES